MRRDEDPDKWVFVRACLSVFVHAFVCERERVYVE